MRQTCINCGLPIPEERLKLLPKTQVCVKCSGQKRYIGYPVFAHKTAPEVVFTDPDNQESFRQLNRGYRRKR